MSATAARMAALEVVRRVRERNAFAHESLDAVLGSSSLDERDAAFATRLAYETIASRGTLEEAIGRYVKSALEPEVADALAVSACEILFLHTPARAAVSQGVELVRSVRPAASRLANAVLRRLSDDTPDFPWGDPVADTAALARLHRHPQWLAERWVAELGRDTAGAVMAADNEPAPLFLAPLGDLEATTRDLRAEGVEVTLGPVPGSLVAQHPSAAIRAASVRERRVLVVDVAAQLTAGAIPLSDGARIADIGAGRGTKSLLIATRAAREGLAVRIDAVDSHEFKLRALEEDARSLGLGDRIVTFTADATTDLAPVLDGALYDAVLVDAPCSGLGTLRRHPDRRWRAQPAEVDALAAVGTMLLSRASELVKPGGFVVYSTCTIMRRENQEVIEGFLGSPEGSAFATDRLDADVPPVWCDFLTEEGWFRSLPAPGGPDGHFIARLVRRDAV